MRKSAYATVECSGPPKFSRKASWSRSRILPGAWTILEQDFATHPPTYIVDVQPDPKSAHYPVKNFPILAKLLAERYQPGAHTAEGVIYRMR